MAKIFKTNTQEQALREITESLKTVASLNKILASDELKDCKIRVNGVSGRTQINEQVPIPFGLLSVLLKDYRKKQVKEIMDKSKANNIRLEDNENEIIGLKTAAEKEKAAEPEPEQDDEIPSEDSYYDM